MLPGIILAAGNSERMGSPKALLSAGDGSSFVTRIVLTLHDAGVVDVVVVTGRDHDAVVNTLSRSHVRPQPIVARNPDPTRGQLSSLRVGMDVVAGSGAAGILVTLVDVPSIAVVTVTRIVTEWRRTRAPIVRPAIGERHGHPVIFDRALFDELRRAPIQGGAKAVVRAHEHEILNVPVDDEGCLSDVDTPEDYSRFLADEPQRRGELK